jgi:hypothetical protein
MISEIESFNVEVAVRSKGLIGNEYLAPSRDRGPSKTISDLLGETGSIRYCAFYKAILNPNGSAGQNYLKAQGHMSNAVIILLAGEWFSKSLYDIWHTGYNGSLQLKDRVDRQWQDLYALLNPEEERWRVYYNSANGDPVYFKEVAAAVNSFYGRSKGTAIHDIYSEYSQYTGFVHALLEKYETGREFSLARFDRYKAMLEAQLAEHKQALDWVNTEARALSDKNFDDWKTMSRRGVELVARLIANKTTLEEFHKEALSLAAKRDDIVASQYYVKEMANMEKDLTRLLENHKTSVFLKLSAIYSAYLVNYTVPDKGAFQQLIPFSKKIDTALQDKAFVEFSRDRIDKLNRENPGVCAQGIIFDLGQCDLAFEQREFYRLFVWEISYGLVENLTQLEKLYGQAVGAQNEVNQWLAQEYGALYKKAETAQMGKPTIEEYQALRGKLDSLSTEARTKFWGLMKPNERYVSIKYNKENMAMTSRLYDVLSKISQSFQ